VPGVVGVSGGRGGGAGRLRSCFDVVFVESDKKSRRESVGCVVVVVVRGKGMIVCEVVWSCQAVPCGRE
jgi:hypothetical protein